MAERETEFPKTSQQGTATLLTEEDQARDDLGFTNPNLHRRIDPQGPPEDSEEKLPRDYILAVKSVYSYRQTTINYHDEDDDSRSEVP